MRAPLTLLGATLVALCGASPLRAPAQTAAPQAQPSAADSARPGALLDRFVRRQLALDDAQAKRLRETSARYFQIQRPLAERERQLRVTVRTQLRAPAPDQAAIGSALDQLLAIRRQRLDVAEREQRELAAFLTPVQRARLLGLREARQRFQQDRQRRADTTASAPRRRLLRAGALR